MKMFFINLAVKCLPREEWAMMLLCGSTAGVACADWMLTMRRKLAHWHRVELLKFPDFLLQETFLDHLAKVALADLQGIKPWHVGYPKPEVQGMRLGDIAYPKPEQSRFEFYSPQ